jgi:pimeloyl-ACP methyl ester carboxylesterase
MSPSELSQLKATTVPKRVVYGADDPQMSAQDAQETAAGIGAPPAIAIPGRHLTMISSPHQVATAIQTLTS